MAKHLKRSVTISGHRTSISLEPEFWVALTTLATSGDKSVAALVGEIDAGRDGRNLSSAIRVHVLGRLRDI
jgi:predicted DNA-binding ribbon-helix-helix protein